MGWWPGGHRVTISHGRGGGRPAPPSATGPTLVAPTLTAGWATFGVPLAPGDLPAGQSLQVAGLGTQTDVKTTYADGSAKFAVVTCKPAGTVTPGISAGPPPASSPFTPALPSSTKVEFALHTRCVLLGVYSVTSGTFKAVLTQVTSGKRIVADVVVLKNTADGTEYVLDDADGAVFSTTGSGWNTLGGGSDSAGWPAGKTVHWTTANGATATWTKTSLPSGTYSVSASWTDWTTITEQGTGDPRATFVIKDNTTTIGTVEVNQIVASAEYVGRVIATGVNIASGTCKVVLDNTSSNGLVVADAVALFKGGVLVSVVDDSDAGCVFSGTWLESGVGWPAGYAYGYKNTYRIANWSSFTGDGSSTATYTWTGLASGSDYTVVAWSFFSPFSTAELDITVMLSTTTHFTVKDNTTTRATTTINQRDRGAHDLVETYRAPLSAPESADFWLRGNLVREHRQAVAPYFVDAGGTEHTSTTHPHLRVLYDCRCYSDGQGRLQVTVENCLDMKVATYVHYDVVVTVAGSSVFSQTDVEQWYGARWSKDFGYGGLSESTVTADWTRAYAGKLLMKARSTCDQGVPSGYYDPDVGGRTFTDWSVSSPYFAILRRGGMDGDGLGGGGFHPQLGTQPMWAMQFLAHGRADAKAYTLLSSRYAGSYPHHFRDSSTGDPINCVDRPNATTNYSQSGSSFLQADGLKGQHDLAGTRFGRWQMADNTPHHPNVSFVPYLYTGERYHHEEVLFWGDSPLLGTLPGLREGAACTPNDAAGCRGIGWQVRGYAEAAAVAVTGSGMATYFTTVTQNCLGWLDAYAAGTKNFGVSGLPYASTLGCAFNMVISDTTEHLVAQAPWQQMYVGHAIQRAHDLGFPTSGADTGGALLDIILGFLINQHGQYDPAHPDDPAFSTLPYHLNPSLLVNAEFHSWCSDQANTPQNWTVAAGTPGTHVVKGVLADSYVTDGCVKLVSDGSTLASVTQAFGTTPSALAGAGGTPDTLVVSSTYYVLFHLKASSAPTVGTVIVDLVNGSGTPLAGCSVTVNASTLTTSYQRFTATFTTPSSISGTPKLRVRFGSSPDSGRTVYLPDVSIWAAAGAAVFETFYSVDALWTTSTSTFAHFTTWDQAATRAIVNSRIDQYGVVFGLPVPSQLAGTEYAYVYLLAFNIAEVRGLANATARYDALTADAGNLTYDGFNVPRGLYV